MNRLVIFMSLLIGLSFTPFAGAESSSSSGGGSTESNGIQGEIQSVTSTNFSVGTHVGHRHHKHLKPIIVHYNPDTTNITVDGAAVKTLDVAVTHKYVTVVGEMKNDVLEATSIVVTSSKPSHPKHSKSKSSTE